MQGDERAEWDRERPRPRGRDQGHRSSQPRARGQEADSYYFTSLATHHWAKRARRLGPPATTPSRGLRTLRRTVEGGAAVGRRAGETQRAARIFRVAQRR